MTVYEMLWLCSDERFQKFKIWDMSEDSNYGNYVFRGYLDDIDDGTEKYMDCEVQSWDIDDHGIICFNIEYGED